MVLADGDEKTGFEPEPFMVIGIIGATPPNPEDRARFAQEAATTIPGVRDAADHHVGADPDRRPAGL